MYTATKAGLSVSAVGVPPSHSSLGESWEANGDTSAVNVELHVRAFCSPCIIPLIGTEMPSKWTPLSRTTHAVTGKPSRLTVMHGLPLARTWLNTSCWREPKSSASTVDAARTSPAKARIKRLIGTSSISLPPIIPPFDFFASAGTVKVCTKQSLLVFTNRGKSGHTHRKMEQGSG